ncbi:DUF1707 SHOCT-like domain-containing protein [Streptomyces capparidis]
MDESELQKKPQPAAPARRPVAYAEIRASDADRDRVAEILAQALAEGRLTTDEHAERLDAAYRSKTVGELEPLTRDLPDAARATAPAPAAPPPAAEEAPAAVAVFGGASRRGRWRVGREVNALAVFGGVEIDLTEAVFSSPEVVVKANAVFGGVEILVPENVSVRGGGGMGLFGGFDVKGHDSADPGAPVVRVRGLALFGGVSVRRGKGKRLKDWGRSAGG